MALSYHLSRWYDPYPRLAFAFQMLDLSPATVKKKAVDQLRVVFRDYYGDDAMLPANRLKGHRWYDTDDDDDVARMMELLKDSPDSIKARMADTLLAVLQHEG